MLQRVWNLFFGKPMTEEERRWATILAVSVERVR